MSDRDWESEYLRVCGLLREERAVRRQLAEALRRVEPELVPNHDAAQGIADKFGLGPLGGTTLVADIRAALAASDALDKETADG